MSIVKSLKSSYQSVSNWFIQTPERSINEAFQEALDISRLEFLYFDGEKVEPSARYSESVYCLINTQLNNKLRIMSTRLTESKISAKVPYLKKSEILNSENLELEKIDSCLLEPNVFDKLEYIDYILERYGNQTGQLRQQGDSNKLSPSNKKNIYDLESKKKSKTTESSAENPKKTSIVFDQSKIIRVKDIQYKNENPVKKHGVTDNKSFQQTRKSQSNIVGSITKNSDDRFERSWIPNSILKTIQRIGKELTSSDAISETEQYRQQIIESRQRTVSVAQFLATLIIATVGIQVLSLHLIYSPLVDHWDIQEKSFSSYGNRVEEAALREFRKEKDRIEFKQLIGDIKELSEIEEKSLLREEAIQIKEMYREESKRGIKNLFADISALTVVYGILAYRKERLTQLRSFLGDTWTSLGDSAKAFIIIAATDIFVGYHSAEGWEALLVALSEHFGVEENHFFILGFIAIIPVILDALFKFWIFQYLKQASPSTATIYREMDD